tara:strand:- start:11904 stop:12107 length:204 start_codon:yes stop_codon:yes gene_type:complete
MVNFKDKLNNHLPIILQLLSTASLIVIALTAICGSKSLKKLSDAHQMYESTEMQEGHNMKDHRLHNH